MGRFIGGNGIVQFFVGWSKGETSIASTREKGEAGGRHGLSEEGDMGLSSPLASPEEISPLKESSSRKAGLVAESAPWPGGVVWRSGACTVDPWTCLLPPTLPFSFFWPRPWAGSIFASPLRARGRGEAN